MVANIGVNAGTLRDCARAGAERVLKQLRAEIVAIERTFPELALPRRRRAVRRSVQQMMTETRRISVEARKTVSERMERYRVERRRAQAKVK
jgi:hypothetical protein